MQRYVDNLKAQLARNSLKAAILDLAGNSKTRDAWLHTSANCKWIGGQINARNAIKIPQRNANFGGIF